jgi:hypothetical protein
VQLLLANVLRALGDADNALARTREALELSERMGTRSLSAAGHELLARLAIGRGEWSEADALAHDALAERVELGARVWIPQTLDPLAQIAGDGRPRSRLSPADAVSLTRFWLVPTLPPIAKHPTGLPVVIVLAGASDHPEMPIEHPPHRPPPRQSQHGPQLDPLHPPGRAARRDPSERTERAPRASLASKQRPATADGP